MAIYTIRNIRAAWCLSVLFALFAYSGYSQKPKHVHFEPYNVLRKNFQTSALSFFYKDSLEVHRKGDNIVAHLHSLGHLLAGIDTGYIQNDTLFLSVYIGETYRKAIVNIDNVSPSALKRTGLKGTFPEIRKFTYREFFRAEQRLIDYYQTIGFPFAYVFLDSVSQKNKVLYGKLKIVNGPFIVFDTLQVTGKTKTKKKFLTNYTKIRPRDPYNQTTIENAHKLLKQLPYLRVRDEPTVSFMDGKAYVRFYLEDRKANQVDGVAGFLPNQQTNAAKGNKLLITGEFNLNLKNMGGKGKGMRIEWKRLKPESQQIDLEYYHPNLFGSAMNIIPSFELLKQDTTFQTVTGVLKTNFNATGSTKIGFYVGSKQSRLLSTKLYSKYTKPPFLDFNLNTYGMDYEWNNLNDYFYPRSGNIFFLDANVGIKSIKRNGRLSDALYDGVKTSTTQFYIKGDFKHFFRLGKRSTLLAGLRGGRVFNDNILITNDLFQIGGLKTLRGFNENFFYSEYYSTSVLEFRQFTDESSYLLLFAEKSFMNYRLGNESVEDWPTGVGAGISLSTNTGIFNFVYSLGESLVQKMQFNQSKVHFGYITRF